MDIEIINASTNNLKNVSLNIPHNKFVVVTGISGSGKSSLVYDTICKEGNRRYFDQYSTYIQQNIGKMERPDVEKISGLRAIVEIKQSSFYKNSRSTIGTITQIHDLLRLAFARFGKYKIDDLKGKKINRSLFSFNTSNGACQNCKGLGVEDKIDIEKLIKDENLSLEQGALTLTTPDNYIIYSQVTMESLNLVCNAHGFDTSIPWKDLTLQQQNIVMYGSDRIKIPYGKHTLESRMKWTGIKAKPREEGFYKGIIPVMENILLRDRNPNILKFSKTTNCSVCNGSRFSEESLKVYLNNKNIDEILNLNFIELYGFVRDIGIENELFNEIKDNILNKLELLIELGCSNLKCTSGSETLFQSEVQKIKLVNQIFQGLTGVIYVFDEPTAGLSLNESKIVIKLLKQLVNNRNSLIVVEHNPIIMNQADWIIEIGPNAGVNGGEIIFNGSFANYMNNNVQTLNKKYLNEYNLFSNNYNNEFTFINNSIHLIEGPQSIEKDNFINEIINTINNNLEKYNIKNVFKIDSSPIGKNSRSNPSTYTKIFDEIRNIFASEKLSKERKYNSSRFSFNTKGGRCENCEGSGQIELGMHFLGNVFIQCEHCNGKRFNDQTLEIKFKGKNINEILEMSISQAVIFFNEKAKLFDSLKIIEDLGLGYIKLGQPTSTLSGGETQRLKLASQLINKKTSDSLFIFEAPTLGLHYFDIEVFINCLKVLVKNKNTILISDNNEKLKNHSDSCYLFNSINTIKNLNIESVSSCKEGILFSGISTNNLKNINVDIPEREITVITGVSGSGKSSLAYDTIFSECQNTYNQSLSNRVRQYINQTKRAKVNFMSGLRPAISITQKKINKSPRSTVGTQTEIYDYYRLLYSRFGKHENQIKFSASSFSFNSEVGACVQCKGLGFKYVLNEEELFLNSNKSLLDGAFSSNKTAQYFGDENGKFIAILKQVAREFEIDLNKTWNDFNQNEREIILEGTGERKYSVIWNYVRNKTKGVHEFNTIWEGFSKLIENEFSVRHQSKNAQEVDLLMKECKCIECNGARLKNDSLKVYYNGLNISELSNKSIEESIEFFRDFKVSDTNKQIIKEIINRLETLSSLGLGYLNIARKSDSLSGGEIQRIRLSTIFNSELSGMLYVLDEPSVGLHKSNVNNLVKILREIKSKDNTIIIVDHDKSIIKSADNIIDIGLNAGEKGGEVIFSGNYTDLLKNETSITSKYIKKEFPSIIIDSNKKDRFSILGCNSNNLKKIDIEIYKNSFTVIHGVSGSGKSSLLFDVIEKSVLHKRAINSSSIKGDFRFNKIFNLTNSVIGSNSLSTVASYLKISEDISIVFERYFKKMKFKKSHFKYNSKDGFCLECKGAGEIKISGDFMMDIWNKCPDCEGKRFNSKVLECKINGLNIFDIYSMEINQIIDFYNSLNIKQNSTVKILKELGLGYLKLGQKTQTLSAGESQRLRLVNSLSEIDSDNNLYLLDEPSTGLHFYDIENLLNMFKYILSKGHTIICIDHKEEIISNANNLIELGPFGGDNGGFVIN